MNRDWPPNVTCVGRLWLRLSEGPATLEEMAEAAWGDRKHWPDDWKRALFNHVRALRERGDTVERLISYRMEPCRQFWNTER